MTLYIFSALKTLRDIVPPAGLTGLVHDESAYTVSATIPMDLTVVPGEHIGFRCVDGRFRMFTVTKAENKDFDATTIITGIDTAVQELKETIVPELQQLDVTLHDAVVALLDASDARSSWSVTGSGPADLKKHRAYYTTMWTMLETLAQLYEWRIIPHYYFASGAITGRTIELAADTATFRGRILQSKKDASNVYVIKSTPPITRLYGLGPSKSQEPGVSENLTFAEAEWSTAAGDPANKPKEQNYVDDPAAVAKYGVRSSTVQFDEVEDEKDLLQKTWNHLQTIKEPTCTVEATVQDLEQVPGYETKIIRLGDLVPVRLSNAAMEEARVIGIKRDYVKPWLTKVTIGDKTASLSTQVTNLMTNALHTHETLTIYKNRFHEDEALIQLNAQFVQANAERIELNAQMIGLNARYIDEVTGRITAAELLLDGMNATIDLWAGRLDEFGNRLDGAEILIDGLNHKITAAVTDMDGKIAALELSLTDLEAKAVLKAAYEEDKAAMLTLISNAEESIATLEAAHDGRIAALELKTNDLESSVLLKAEYEENRAADLKLISNAQESVATLETKYDGQIASLELRADEQGSMIAAKADLILLEGYVKASELEAETLKVVEGATLSEVKTGAFNCSGIGTINTLYATGAVIQNLNVPNIIIGGESFNPADYATQEWVMEQGFLTSAPGGFATQSWVIDQGYATSSDVAETLTNFVMQGELDGYATENWVEGKGYLTEVPSGYATQEWVAENFSKASVAYKPTAIERYGSVSGTSIPVRALNESGTVLLTGTVDAGDVYSNGASSVTLTGVGWVSGSFMVRASNGKTYSVNHPTVSLSGGTTWNANHQTTVYAYSNAVSGYLTYKTIDATSVYTAGETAGADSVTLSAGAWESNKMTVNASNGKTLEVDATSIFQAGSAGGYNAGYEIAIVGAMIELDGSTVRVFSPDGGIAGPTLDISSNLESSYNSGYNAGMLNYKPTSASISATVSGASGYTISVALTNTYGNSVGTFSGLELDARDVYDNGWDDGYKAATDSATITCEGTNAIVTFSDGSTKTLDLSSYVTVTGGIRSITNTAQNYYMAQGYANAYINGVDVDYTTFSKAQSFG